MRPKERVAPSNYREALVRATWMAITTAFRCNHYDPASSGINRLLRLCGRSRHRCHNISYLGPQLCYLLETTSSDCLQLVISPVALVSSKSRDERVRLSIESLPVWHWGVGVTCGHCRFIAITRSRAISLNSRLGQLACTSSHVTSTVNQSCHF